MPNGWVALRALAPLRCAVLRRPCETLCRSRDELVTRPRISAVHWPDRLDRLSLLERLAAGPSGSRRRDRGLRHVLGRSALCHRDSFTLAMGSPWSMVSLEDRLYLSPGVGGSRAGRCPSRLTPMGQGASLRRPSLRDPFARLALGRAVIPERPCRCRLRNSVLGRLHRGAAGGCLLPRRGFDGRNHASVRRPSLPR